MTMETQTLVMAAHLFAQLKQVILVPDSHQFVLLYVETDL